ncbi:MAG: glycerol-3-phosphate dehydrogenase subunit GlpB [Actinomycetota bacterium]|nr:glycerol-3-phosphate dehydrogenase subunit GlpB [Actinomycetota bacterium]
MRSRDTIVVGAGLAGLAAALRLVEERQRVLVLARGVGATHLAPPTIDVVGYVDGRVASPLQALAELAAARPEHPYASVGPSGVDAAVRWFKECAPLPYVGDLRENFLLPTPVGAVKPSAVVPAGMAAGDVRAGGRFVFVGFRALKDFYPAYLAANLERSQLPDASLSARAVELPLGGEADVSPVGLARRFEDADFRAALARALAPQLDREERVGFPAVLGLSGADWIRRELEERLERPVFEVPTLPPSVPGMRLYNGLEERLRRMGVRTIVGSPVIGAETTGRRVEAVVVRNAAREVRYRAHTFVLATGGFSAGGLEMDSFRRVREVVFDLPIAGVPREDEPLFGRDYLGPQPLARAGVAVDETMRPVGAEGRAVYENLFAAGAALAGAEPWREQSGNGVSLATGYAAAGAILAGATAMAGAA